MGFAHGLTDIHQEARNAGRMPVMETIERNQRLVRQEFTEKFKADVVARCQAGERSIK